MTDKHDLQLLDPEQARIFHVSGILRLTLDDRSYRAIRIYRAFPISDPDHYYGITDGGGKDVGMIADPSKLDARSLAAAHSELEQRYFVPVVQHVLDIRDDYGATIFDVETDRGQKRYVVRSMRDNMVELSSRRLLITDVDGNRFEVADLYALDPRSQTVLLKNM